MNGMSSFTFLNALLLHKVQFVIKTFTLQKFHFYSICSFTFIISFYFRQLLLLLQSFFYFLNFSYTTCMYNMQVWQLHELYK
jgi:hypothetical protein